MSAAPLGLRAATPPSARRALLVLAWVVGVLGGMAPVAFVGDAAPGLAAGALLGAAAWAWTAPLVVVPWLASDLARDDGDGLAAALHAAGLGTARRRARRAAGGAVDVAAAGTLAALAGTVAAVGAGGAHADPWRSAPQASGVLAGLALLGGSLLVAVLLAAAARSTTAALVWWAAAVLATGAAVTTATFVPAARPAVTAAPLLALWPLHPDHVAATTLALVVAPTTRVASLAAWSLVLAGVATWRFRRHPYPTHDPGHRRRRTPR